MFNELSFELQQLTVIDSVMAVLAGCSVLFCPPCTSMRSTSRLCARSGSFDHSSLSPAFQVN